MHLRPVNLVQVCTQLCRFVHNCVETSIKRAASASELSLVASPSWPLAVCDQSPLCDISTIRVVVKLTQSKQHAQHLLLDLGVTAFGTRQRTACVRHWLTIPQQH